MLLMEVLGEWEQEEWDFFWIEDLEETKEAERLDAEHFHPKYKELLEKIKSYKRGFCALSEVCEIKNGSFVSDENYISEKQDIGYIRIKEIQAKGGINKDGLRSKKGFKISHN